MVIFKYFVEFFNNFIKTVKDIRKTVQFCPKKSTFINVQLCKQCKYSKMYIYIYTYCLNLNHIVYIYFYDKMNLYLFISLFYNWSNV